PQPFNPPQAAAGATALKVSLSSPQRARVGSEFSVSVIAEVDTPASAVTTDVIYNPAYLEMTSARAGDLSRNAQFDSKNAPGRVMLSVQKQDGLRGRGPLATLTFRVKEKTNLPLWLGIGQVQASSLQGTEMPVSAAEPRSLEVE
ncbi:MAG: cohesin domain-containing protein, partial [Burkholderiales bacterium]